MNSTAKAKYIIENNKLMTVATADQNGKPWISPVGYVNDEGFNLYWVSSKDALHSKNIRNRPEVAIVIVGNLPDGATDGVYFDAKAIELSDEKDIKVAINVLNKRVQDDKFKTKSISDVTGNALWRIYKATPSAIFKRGDKTLNGQAITVREPIVL